jgi:hypothetical protein
MRFRGLSSLVIVLTIASALMIASQASAAGPKHDSVVGTGIFDPVYGTDLYAKVHVNAQSDPSGLNARGKWSWTETGWGYIAGSVYCLEVSGDSATIGLNVETASNPAEVGKKYIQVIHDSGSGVRGDRSVTLAYAASGADCVESTPGFALGHGNFVVKDS